LQFSIALFFSLLSGLCNQPDSSGSLAHSSHEPSSHRPYITCVWRIAHTSPLHTALTSHVLGALLTRALFTPPLHHTCLAHCSHEPSSHRSDVTCTCLAHCRYVESVCRVQTLSLTAMLLYCFCDGFVVQWKELALRYPRSTYLGRLC
jgi:hypothetical protein